MSRKRHVGQFRFAICPGTPAIDRFRCSLHRGEWPFSGGRVMQDARECVSIVDDDALVLRSLGRLLHSAGFAVETFSSPHEFLRRWSENPPGCVVMDLSMPGLSGLELQRALVEGADAPPVVFITGAGDIPSTVQAMKAGAVDFLTKPLDEAKLIGAVRIALQRDRSARERRAGHASITARLVTLTPREREVLVGVV